MSGLFEMGIEALIGCALWMLAGLLPLRAFTSRPEFGWDVFAVLCGIGFSVAALALWVPVETGLGPLLQGWYRAIDAAPAWLIVPAYVLVADCGAYWAHRLLHSRWLWPTHAWHHAPKHLYWLSGARGSPVHTLVLLLPYAAAYMLLPAPETGIAGIALLLIDAGNQHLIHSNIRIPRAAAVERLFVTPRFHFVHHNADPRIANSNYGFIFSFWDRLFGSYTDPATIPADAPLGLDYEASNWRLLFGLPARTPASGKPVE